MGELWKSITEHPIISSTIALIVFVATVWPVFISSDTIPEFLAKNGWAVTVPSWYYSFVVMLGCAVVALQISIFRVARTSKKEVVMRDEEIARLKRLLKEREEYSQVNANEIMHPPEGGVLWQWNQKSGVGGPFCPHHKSRLFYRDHYRGEDKIENFDESFLSGSGWFVCPLDPTEEFIFVKLGPITVGQLRAQAAERLKVKLENEIVPPHR